MTPLPRWIEPGRWSLANSLSSRTSTRRNLSPRSILFFTSSTLVSRTRVRASSTILRKRGGCWWAMRYPFRGRPKHKARRCRNHSTKALRDCARTQTAPSKQVKLQSDSVRMKPCLHGTQTAKSAWRAPCRSWILLALASRATHSAGPCAPEWGGTPQSRDTGTAWAGPDGGGWQHHRTRAENLFNDEQAAGAGNNCVRRE